MADGSTHRNLSDFSDFDDYDSSDSEYRAKNAKSQSRRGSHAAPKKPTNYDQLSDDDEPPARKTGGGSKPYDPFSDPDDFLGSIGGSSSKPKKQREECEFFGSTWATYRADGAIPIRGRYLNL